jgi:hypothetical protein
MSSMILGKPTPKVMAPYLSYSGQWALVFLLIAVAIIHFLNKREHHMHEH